MLNCQELGLLLIGPHSKYTLIPPPISTLYFQTPITNKSSCHRDLQLLHSRYEAIISLKKKKKFVFFLLVSLISNSSTSSLYLASNLHRLIN